MGARSESEVDPWMGRYPPADVTPAGFELYVVEMLKAADVGLESLEVNHSDRIQGTDGVFEFDATVRYHWQGLTFLVIVEAKLHRNPIKREVAQALHSKVLSVGAHKGVMISTTNYQSGAVRFAKTHGLALISVTNAGWHYHTRDLSGPAALPEVLASSIWTTGLANVDKAQSVRFQNNKLSDLLAGVLDFPNQSQLMNDET